MLRLTAASCPSIGECGSIIYIYINTCMVWYVFDTTTLEIGFSLVRHVQIPLNVIKQSNIHFDDALAAEEGDSGTDLSSSTSSIGLDEIPLTSSSGSLSVY